MLVHVCLLFQHGVYTHTLCKLHLLQEKQILVLESRALQRYERSPF